MFQSVLSNTTRSAARLAVLSLVFVGSPVLGSTLAGPGEPVTVTLSGPAAAASEAAEATVETIRVPEVPAEEDAPGTDKPAKGDAQAERDAQPQGEAQPESQAPAEGEAAPAEEGSAPEDEQDSSPEPEETAPEVTDEPAVVANLSATRTENYGLVGVTWVAGSAPADLQVQVRSRTEGEWLPWEDLEVVDIDSLDEVVREGTEPVWVGDSDGVGVRLISQEHAPTGIQTVLIDGGTGLARPADLQLTSATYDPTDGETAQPYPAVEEEPTEVTPVSTTSWPVAPKPAMVTRAQWGVDRRYEQSCSSPVRSKVLKGITLHHTAGSNGYSREQAPGIVRATHLYHTRSLGWCDIGYNFLVDTFGTVYVGRRGGVDAQVRGAHAGNYDANTYTSGISMMGNYDTVDVPQAMRTAVTNVMAWRLSSFNVKATGRFWIDGKSMNNISGHRDYSLAGVRPATATACPGRYGVKFLEGGLRQAVQARIDAVANGWTPPPTSEPSPSPVPAPPPETDPRTVEPPAMSGRTVRPDRKPVGGIRVTARDTYGQRVTTVTSTVNGYKLELPPGEYTLWFEDTKDRFADATSGTVQMTNGNVSLADQRLLRRAPKQLASPSLKGPAWVKSTMSFDLGRWATAPKRVQYTWVRDGVTLPATGPTYVLGLADRGSTIAAYATLRWGGNYEAKVIQAPSQFRITKAPSTSSGRLKADTIKPWNRGRVIASVTSPDNPKPVGPVQIRLRGTKTLATRRIFARQEGTRMVALPKLPEGRYRLRVYYRGSMATNPSNSNLMVLVVRR